MTVRVELNGDRVAHSRHGLKWLEYLLLFFGLAAVDYYIWASAGAALSQAYDHWSFAEQLQGQATSVLGFLRNEIHSLAGIHSLPARAGQATTPRPQESANRPQPMALIGRIEIPRLNLDLMVREGVTEDTLARAVGHIPSSALPGQHGNVALAAHRDTFFRPLRNIRTGDAIEVETVRGTYQYRVESIQIVTPQDTQVLNATNRPELTLITCYPFYYVGSAPKRFIVRAVQIAGTDRQPAAVRSD